jgi:hypothetical protein
MPRKKELSTRSTKLVESAYLDIINNPCVPKSQYICYAARFMAQFGLPHRALTDNYWERKNGDATLMMVSRSKKGIAWGSIPRLVMSWATSWQVRHPNADVIELGKNLTRFISAEQPDGLGLPNTGRYIKRVKLETFKLFSSSVSVVYEGRGGMGYEEGPSIATKVELWENPNAPDQDALFDSYIVFNKDFREQLIEHPIPVDWRAYPALMPSSLAMDYYHWLAYRFSYLTTPTKVTWTQLGKQFGTQYDWTKRESLKDFRRESMLQLGNRVLKVYPQARVKINDEGLWLFPSPTPVPMTTKTISLPPAKK